MFFVRKEGKRAGGVWWCDINWDVMRWVDLRQSGRYGYEGSECEGEDLHGVLRVWVFDCVGDG